MDSTFDASNSSAIQQSFSGAANTAEKGAFAPFGDDGFSFLDVLDIINPLQHIPIVSTLYREMTGDELSPASRVAGGALYGGPIGALASVANVVVEEISGKDVGEHLVELFEGEDAPSQVADWPEGGLTPAAVDSEELPPIGAQAANAEPGPADEDPVTAWARATVNGSLTTAAAAEDPVSAWARQEARIRSVQADPVPAAADPVASWAAGEINARSAEATPPVQPTQKVAESGVDAWAHGEASWRQAQALGLNQTDSVAAWARRETRQVAELAAQGGIGTQAPADAGVLALLQEAHLETDAADAARHQSYDLGERGRDDRSAETASGEAAWRGDWTPATASYQQVANLGTGNRVDPASATEG